MTHPIRFLLVHLSLLWCLAPAALAQSARTSTGPSTRPATTRPVSTRPMPSVAQPGAMNPAVLKPLPDSVDDLKALQKQVREVVAKVTPAVVGLQIGGGQGSGVLITDDGFVL